MSNIHERACEQRRLSEISYASNRHPYISINVSVHYSGSFRSLFLQTSAFSIVLFGCFSLELAATRFRTFFSFVHSGATCVFCVCVCVPAIPFAVPFVLFVFAMAMRFIRFDFSLHFRVGMEMAMNVRARCEETDEIVCRRLVEIDIREVSMFRQLYVNVDGTFRLKIQIVSISFVRQPYYRFGLCLGFLFPFVLRRVPIEFPHRKWHGSECNLTILSKQYYRLDVDQSNGTYYMRRAQRNTLIHC